MNNYRRPENLLESLLRWRRNVFLQSPGGGYVLVSATRYLLTLHHFSGSVRSEPTHTEHREPIPGLFDGNGWNWASLNKIESIFPQNDQIQSEIMMPETTQQPYAALYCKPLRASIRNMTDVEMKVFVALTTYADDQGICFPGVRALTEDTGKSATDVSEALDGLMRKGFFVYLRHKAVDPITRKMQPDVYGLTGAILHTTSVTGIQTYMFEFLLQLSPSNHAQPDSINQNQNPESEPTPVTTTTNQLQDAPAREEQENSLEGKDSGKDQDYANQSPQPAAQLQPKAPENDVPPRDEGRLDSFIAPLPQIDKEAYAHEMRQLVPSLQLAKARQLVEVYGIEMCATAVRLLGKQPFKSINNPPGWVINKLRQGALVPEDGKGQYDDFANS
jgi:hypothetical protein